MWLIVDQHNFSFNIINNSTTRALTLLLPLSLDMIELNGNEKYANLPKSLPINPIQPQVIQEGDLMLYGSKTLVIFYKTFVSSYFYTPVGHIKENDRKELISIIRNGNKKFHFIKINT